MTTMRFVYTIRRAAMLGLVALWCLAPMRSASAQVAIAGNYYEEVKSSSGGCISVPTTFCALIFSATPQIVFFTDVSCQFETNLPIFQTAFGVSDSSSGLGGFRRFESFPPQLVSTANYAAKFKTSFLIGSGKFPMIFLQTVSAGTAIVNCKIVGTFQVP